MGRHEVSAEKLTVEPANDSETWRCGEIHGKADGYDRRSEGKLFRVSDWNEGRVVVDFEKGDTASRVGSEKLGGHPSIAVNHKDFLCIGDNIRKGIYRARRVGEEPSGAQLSVAVVGLYTNRRTVAFVE